MILIISAVGGEATLAAPPPLLAEFREPLLVEFPLFGAGLVGGVHVIFVLCLFTEGGDKPDDFPETKNNQASIRMSRSPGSIFFIEFS